MIDTVKFLGLHQQAFPQPDWDWDIAAGLRVLVSLIDSDPGMQNPAYQAYVVATVRRECGQNYKPVRESWWVRDERARRDLLEKQYGPGTRVGRTLGNTQPGDGWLFAGRGYVQTTGRANYAKASMILGKDCIKDPDILLNPADSYKTVSAGLLQGHYTGRKLADYFDTPRFPDRYTQYYEARRIVNPGELISNPAKVKEQAQWGMKIEQMIKEAQA